MKRILLCIAALAAVICCTEPKEAKASTNDPTLLMFGANVPIE